MSIVNEGGNCHKIEPNFSFKSEVLEKNASIGSEQSLSFLTCVMKRLPLREKVNPSGAVLYHFENVSLVGRR